MLRYQILIEYVGTNYRGWQIQKKGKTIQGLISRKLSKLLKEKILLLVQEELMQGCMQLNNLLILNVNNIIEIKINF